VRGLVAALIAAVLATSTVVPASASTITPMRGINLAGAEFTSAGLPLFDTPESFAFLASRGYTVVRLPFLWESVQPVLSGPLAAAAMTPLKKAVTDATAAGLAVILDVHNYAVYRGVAYGAAGSFTEHDFTDLWTRLSSAFRGTIAGYGLMNEPRNLPAVDGISGNIRWQHAQQAALDAIRANGDTTCVLVSGYTAATMGGWLNATNGQPVPYITDPANNFRWEAHHYWDAGSTGKYTSSYADAVAAGFGSSQGDAARTRTWFELNQWLEWLKKYNQKGYIGEFGWPSVENGASEADATAWNSLAELYLNRIAAESPDLVWTTAWATGSRWSSGYRLQFYSSSKGSLASGLSNAAVLESANPAPTPTEPEVVAPPVAAEPEVTASVAAVASAAPVVPVVRTVKVSVTHGKRPVLTVRVSPVAAGTVVVTYRGKTVGKAKLVKGRAKIVLRKLTKGSRVVTVRVGGLSSKVRVRVK